MLEKKEIDRFASSVLLVVVTHDRIPAETEAMRSLVRESTALGQRLRVVLFDNGPRCISPLSDLSSIVDIAYVPQPHNPGLSHSYNKASMIARKEGLPFMLLLDQDAILLPEFLHRYTYYTHCHADQHLFCPLLRTSKGWIISPARFKFSRASMLRNQKTGVVASRNMTVANNGMLIRTQTFTELGGYEPDLPLDFSDTHFFEKYKRRYATFAVMDFTLPHKLDSVECQDKHAALMRYRIYCQGARTFAKLCSEFGEIGIYALFRGLRLCIRFRSLGFLTLYHSDYLKGRNR